MCERFKNFCHKVTLTRGKTCYKIATVILLRKKSVIAAQAIYERGITLEQYLQLIYP